MPAEKCQSMENIGSVIRVEPAFARMHCFVSSARARSAAQMQKRKEQ